MEQTITGMVIVAVIFGMSYSVKPVTTRVATWGLFHYLIQTLGIIIDTMILIAEDTRDYAKMIARKIKKLPTEEIKEQISRRSESFKLTWRENFSIHDIVIKK